MKGRNDSRRARDIEKRPAGQGKRAALAALRERGETACRGGQALKGRVQGDLVALFRPNEVVSFGHLPLAKAGTVTDRLCRPWTSARQGLEVLVWRGES